MEVSRVKIASDAYMVCLHHALTTECEEIMGLLIGQFSESQIENYSVICNIQSAVTLRRSDKRKDRVEISPEMLIEAQQKAELMSAASNQDLHIVGWYHSHPHITVWPSDIDLHTQAGYQQMDSRFIGLIFSVYNEDKKSKIGSQHLTCFQAANANPEGRMPNWSRVSIPFDIVPASSISSNNQQALETLIMTLFEEQNEVLEESRKKFSDLPLAHLHNSSVMVRSVCSLSQLICGPLVASLEKEMQNKIVAIQRLKGEADYLKKLMKLNGIDPPV